MKQKMQRGMSRGVLLLFLTMLVSTIALAQKKVTGKVTGSDGLPIAGASVLVKGTTTGTATLDDGTFALNVEPGAVLVVSANGVKTREITVPASGVMSISVESIAGSLNEVIVTGYTTQRKKDITGAVAVVDVKEMAKNPNSNVENLLQGRASGVNVTSSGVPGAGANIRIRGFSTFGSNDPLFVVDGMQLNSIADLNPGDIESLQVLKDASAAAVYGSAAANGVVIITTKRGKSGSAKVSYDAYYGTQYFNKGLDLLNTEEYGQYLWKMAINAGQDSAGYVKHGQYGGGKNGSTSPVIPDYIFAGTSSGVMEGDPAADPNRYKLDLQNVEDTSKTYLIMKANKTGTDWLHEIIKPAPIMNHALTVSGGTAQGNYLFGLNYYDQQGMVVKTGYKRYSVRMNSNFNIKNHVKIGENVQINYIDEKPGFTNQDESNAILMAIRNQPIIPVYDIKGNWAGTRGSNLGNAGNPVADRYRNAENGKSSRVGVIGNVYAEIEFAKHFAFRSNFGIDWNTYDGHMFNVPHYESSEGRGGTGSYNEDMNWGYQMTWFNTLRYQQTFGKSDISALIGTELKQSKYRGTGGSSNTYFSFDRNFYQVSSGQSATPYGYSYESDNRQYTPILAKLDYTFDGKYIFSGSYRRDGDANAFGPDNKYGNFGGVSLGWRMTEMSFMKNSKLFNDLKLRVGYGVLGNNRIPGFGYKDLYSLESGYTSYPMSGGVPANSGFRLTQVGNPKVQWEVAGTANIGIDATMLNNKLNVILEFYNKKTSKLLFPVQLDPSVYGYVASQYQNIGEMTNNGVDLTVNYNGTINKEWRFNVGMNFSMYKNNVDKIVGDFVDGSATRIAPFNRSVVGQPFMSFYGYKIDGFFESQADLDKLDQGGKFIGGWRYKDISGPDGKPDGKIDGFDKTFIGNPHPKFTAGFNIGLAYKRFDLSAFIYWKCGGDIANYVRYWSDFNTFQGNRTRRVLYDSWEKPGDNKKLPRLNAADGTSGQDVVDYYIEPGGYLRLKNLSIGYTLSPELIRKVGLDKLRFYVQAQNILTITNYTGLDPEIGNFNTGRSDYRNQAVDYNMGVDAGNFPVPRMLTFGLNLTF
ncbi:SusC/RagA family TonB-linked outer membrane protein [Flavihumibacter profundi]|uniref:SusC/RagA family TonB-linked outer membrane protein n=1 Tax=Flavihumibacter profundi TaxID=2716883 RepID=UPI001CC75EC7|nr:TonB-dependent receptor [Flavihumibacter profundi]MBZ5856461.1 TonB-dependent receptor [Flavihumibacter profundi]